MALKLFSKNVINYLAANWKDNDDVVTALYFITAYPLLAVYTNINCKALTELTAFSLYFLIEVYGEYAVSTDGYDDSDTVLFTKNKKAGEEYDLTPWTKEWVQQTCT